ncbi:hypothetical protein [Cupriavidus necator]|uniref:hypothetical protein n=1 Tax=Cupriavidus necator TaxID=106590 RepID=UPI00138DDCC4|nr:hypothetical protein [Cupriavidus necator]
MEVISASSLVAIIDACEEELEEIASRLDYGGVLISEGKRAIEEGHTDLKNVSVCLAMLAAKYPNVLPTLEDIGKENRSLGYAATEHGARTLASYLYSSPRDLVPLVILLTIATVFNPNTVLRLKWSAIDRNFLRLGLRGIRVIGEKARAKKDLVRLLDPSASISRKFCFDYLLDLLERITSRIRPVCEKKDRDRVFVFVPKVGQKRVISFTDDTLRSSGWRPKLQEFIADNRLPNFTLGQIRPTIIDMVQQFDGGLEAARAVGNHSRMSTTWTHYTSDGARKRNREKVGEVILLRERWINTQGKIDPRRLTNTDDRAAATPGFRCLDPFDSPSPGQRSGVLCKDYGGCPTCPLAVARPNDAISVAYYLALKSSLLASQVQMSGNSWSCRWAPRLSALNNLLNMVPEQIMSKALRFHISLPQVG